MKELDWSNQLGNFLCTIDELQDKIDKLLKENTDLRKALQTFQNQNPNNNCLVLNDANAETEELDKEIDLLHEAKENLRGKVKALKELVKMEIKDIAKETHFFEEEIKKDILYSQV